MKIGIIGTGNMGRALGGRWAGVGHEVLFGSRDPRKAAAVAGSAGKTARAGDFDAAAAFGDVVLYTVREPLPSRLLHTPSLLDGKIVIDCNNTQILGFDAPPHPERKGFQFVSPIPSLAEQLAADIPRARVVKAFNTVPSPVIDLERAKLASMRVSVFLCSDDAEAKTVVRGLVEEIGFVGVDSGSLDRTQLVEKVADFIRFQILELGTGVLTTISLYPGAPS